MTIWNVPQATVEASLLASCLEDSEAYQRLLSHGVSADDFVVHRPAFVFLDEFLKRWGSLPSNEQIRAHVGDWQPVEGAYDLWWERFDELRTARRAQLSIQEAIKQFSQTPSRSVVAKLVSELQALSIGQGEHVSATDAGALARFAKFEARQAAGLEMMEGCVGIPSGFGAIMESKIGWMPGELVGIYARPTVGKSWVLAREAALAWQSGARVLFISPENPTSTAEIRFDAAVAATMGLYFSHHGAVLGSNLIADNYKRIAEAMAQSARWWTVDSIDDRTAGLSDIVALYHRFKPDVIYVDGISLLHNEWGRGTAMWEQVFHNSYGLKHFATHQKIPIIVTHQAVNTARGQAVKNAGAAGRGDDWRMPTLNDAAHGDDFVRACSTIITMAPDRHRDDCRWYSVRKRRDVETNPRLAAIYWAVDRGVMLDMFEHVEMTAALDAINALSKQKIVNATS